MPTEVGSFDGDGGKVISKVLVLYTGGTIGMKKVNGFYRPEAKIFLRKIKSYPELYDETFTKTILDGDEDENLMAIPNVTPGCSIVYRIEEYDPLIDSSNMMMNDWKRIASDIQANYDKYDGFVILHGTDTMAYTSSALSFMFRGLKKTVILTGSQIPIFERRSDAKDNFYTSLIYASSIKFHIPEVCICFAGKLLRGNRTIKYSSDALKAFYSPNYPLLGNVGMDYKVFKEYVRDHDDESFGINDSLIGKVTVLQLFPGIPTAMIETVLKSVQGLVLLSYGTGNIPSSRTKLINVLKRARENEILIVNVTQCTNGNVYDTYETAKELASMGIVSGKDMTTEAALTKLCYVLGCPGLTFEERQRMMTTNLRGELSCDTDNYDRRHIDKINN